MHISVLIGLKWKFKCSFISSECCECNQNEMFKIKKSLSAVKNAGFHQVLKFSKVCNGESPIGQCIGHLTFSGILDIKYAPIV
jgi:hypothetical protein